MPTQIIITPIWANVGVYGPEDREKVDNGNIMTKFFRRTIRDFTTNIIRSKSLAFDLLTIVDPTTDPTTVAPNLHMHSFVKTSPNSAIFLPHKTIHPGFAKLRRSSLMGRMLPLTTSSNNTTRRTIQVDCVFQG